MTIDSDQLDIFSIKCIEQLINYRWNTYALPFHAPGFIFHSFYVLSMIVLVLYAYIQNHIDTPPIEFIKTRNNILIAVIVGAASPIFYEIRQI